MRDARCVHCLEDAAILPPGAATFSVLLRYQPGPRRELVALRQGCPPPLVGRRATRDGGRRLGVPRPRQRDTEQQNTRAGRAKVRLSQRHSGVLESRQSVVVYHHPAPMAEGTEERIRMAARLVRGVVAGGPAHPAKPEFHRWTRENSGRGVRELPGRWPGLHWVDGRSAKGLQSSHRPLWPSADVGQGKMAGRGRSKRHSAPGGRELAGTLGWPVDGSVADGRRQAGSGIACSRARARLNCSSHGSAGEDAGSTGVPNG